MNGVPSLDFAYLVPPVLALVAVIFLAATGKLAQFSPLRTRVFVFSLGALLSVPWIALLNSNLTAFRWSDPLVGGLEWLLLYEIARPLMRRLARRRLLAFFVSYAVVSFVRVPIGSFIYFCYYIIAQGANFDFARSGPTLVQWLSRSFQYSSTYPYYLYSLLDTFTLIVLIFCCGKVKSLISSTRKREFWQTGAFGGAGRADMEMPSLKSHTTRLLCSSAFLADLPSATWFSTFSTTPTVPRLPNSEWISPSWPKSVSLPATATAAIPGCSRLRRSRPGRRLRQPRHWSRRPRPVQRHRLFPQEVAGGLSIRSLLQERCVQP